MPTVSLRPITSENLRDVCRLEVADHQDGLVAPNVFSLAQAYVEEHARPFAIYADEEPVGFVMLSAKEEQGEYWVWRFMIGADFQGRGLGRSALEAVVERVRALPGARELKLSYVPKESGNPRGFYEKLGFALTGEEDDGELVMSRAL